MNFNLPYDRGKYIEFFRNQFLPEDFDASSENISLSFSPQYTQQVTKIGQASSLDLNVYEVQHTSENDPRVSLSKESFRLLAEYGQKRALVLFISQTSENYRLSLVTIDLKWEEGKRPTREYSNPKRFSFFLGPDAKVHTPEQYLVGRGRVKDFGDLRDRFSIEVVNKDFYTEIAKRFTELTGGKRKIGSRSFEVKAGILVFPSPDDTKRKEFAVRLIGRLVFCWFLKKKHSDGGSPLLPEELLSSEGVKRNRNYYHSVLEPLFFEVLNSPMDGRPKQFQSEPWSLIPFLNGGLFTDHEDDFYGRNKNERAQSLNTLVVPNDWLEKLVGIFEIYNFTIDENTPVDVELSIEPEMLGRIFENLLAEINPDTGETARKATGSYYTPRPIVEYMVDESLKQYLLSKTDISEPEVTSLLSYTEEEPSLSDSQKDGIIDALDTIKVIDPACGSGAFPMGILQKILLILQKIDPDSKKWLSRILAKIDDTMIRKELGIKLHRETLEYIHKLGIIRDAIYGVDIQPIAVEVSKLRCFLSLIVDETIDDTQLNRGIEPLPNLEFKFVCANTLLELPEQGFTETKKSRSKYGPKEYKDQNLMFEASNRIKELKELREKYLRSYGKEKKQIEERFRKVQGKMFEHALNWGGKESQTLKLSQWNPFSDEPCPWFDPEWMFGINSGFDIIIANPPYVVVPKNELKGYVLTAKNNNTYIAFTEKALKIISENGNVIFIIPTTWLSGNNFRKFRTKLLNEKLIKSIVQLPYDIFKAAYIDNLILELSYGRISDKIKTFQFDIRSSVRGSLEYDLFNENEWLDSKENVIFLNRDLLHILGFVKRINTFRLGDVAKVQRGTLPPKEHEQYSEPGKDLMRWFNHQVYRYTISYSGKDVYVQLHILREGKPIELFKCPKILGRQLISRQFRLQFTYFEDEYAFKKNLYAIYDLDNSVSCYYLLGILNSKMYSYLQVNINASGQRDDYPSFSLKDYKNFLIPMVSKSKEKTIEVVVKYLLFLRQTNHDNSKHLFSFFDQLVDGMVFELYFKDKLKSAGRDVWQYLGNLKPITDSMSDKEKLSTIQSEYERLNAEDNQVRNNLFYMTTIPEIRIILGLD